jgi:hypothetical protein
MRKIETGDTVVVTLNGYTAQVEAVAVDSTGTDGGFPVRRGAVYYVASATE